MENRVWNGELRERQLEHPIQTKYQNVPFKSLVCFIIRERLPTACQNSITLHTFVLRPHFIPLH